MGIYYTNATLGPCGYKLLKKKYLNIRFMGELINATSGHTITGLADEIMFLSNLVILICKTKY